MTEKEFVIWLHGFLEISQAKTLDEKQLQVIKDHLETFFIKITPDRENKNNHKEDPWSEKIKQLEELVKEQQKESYSKWPIYPTIPYYPLTPTYPTVGPDVIYCGDDTTSPPPNLGKTYC